MHAEIASAASHVASLLVPSSPTRSSQEAFKATLAASLQSRYASSWTVDDAERGSASRALHWQPGPGGEGCSSPVLKACNKTNTRLGDSEWTLWVDPGCVAIRDGAGPGRSSSMNSLFHQQIQHSRSFAQDHVRVLYGSHSSPSRSRPSAPALTVDFAPATSRPAILSHPAHRFAPSAEVPSVTVCPSTPAFDADITPGPTPIVPWSKDASGGLTLALSSGTSSSRRSSVSSSAGSVAYSTLSMDREQSSSSNGTSIPATSPPTSASWCKLSFDQDEITDAVGGHQQVSSPQKFHSPTSSLDEGSGDAELRGLGLEDVAFEDQDELGPEDALDEQDERCNEGDDTLRPMDQPEDTTIELPKKTSIISHSRSSSVASNVTSFDNGNVGVLGGGIKLGSSSAGGRGRSRATSNASNASSHSHNVPRSRQRSVESRTYGWAQQQQRHLTNGLGLYNMTSSANFVPHHPYDHQQQQQQPQVSGPLTAQQTYFVSPAPSSQYLQDLQSHAEALQSRLNEAKQALQEPRQSPSPPLETVSLARRKEGPVGSTAPVLGMSNKSNSGFKAWVTTSSQEDLDTPKLSDGSWSVPPKPAGTAATDATDEGEDDDNENDSAACQDSGFPGKRVRTRGRRSRGRGAGRAARRAAAAAAMSAGANGLSPAMLSSPHLHMNGSQWSPSPVVQQGMFASPPIMQQPMHSMGYRPQPGPIPRPAFASFSPQFSQQHHRFPPSMHPTRPYNANQPGWHTHGEAW